MNRIDQDHARFWRHPRFSDMMLLAASFSAHRYALHTHPTYVLGVITRGVERFRVGRRQHVAPAGSLIFVNPEEPHDGEPGAEGGWSYRTWYPPIALVAEIGSEMGLAGAPAFAEVVVEDAALSARLLAAHRLSEAGEALEAEEAFLIALRDLVARNAGGEAVVEAGPRSASPDRLKAYDAVIRDHLDQRIELHMLADAVGLSRFQVVRDMKRLTGLTPGEYVRGVRLAAARHAIAEGVSLAEAAMIAGFSDQSHLSRVFKAIHGITPRMYQAAVVG